MHVEVAGGSLNWALTRRQRPGATVAAEDEVSQQPAGRVSFTESGWFLVRAIADNPRTFRFASTAPFYVEIGQEKRRISRTSTQFFLDWVIEREKQIRSHVQSPAELREVLSCHESAKRYWEDLVRQANAE